ncbi:MAG: HAMP domain-containing protein [Anaerolineae bacterium]|nr:HAMP domain-containing protein [Anaerolineae bacterium]
MNNQLASNKIIRRLGGWYILLVVAAGQLIGFLGALPGLLTIQFNVELGDELRQLLVQLAPILILFGQLILLGISWWSTPHARKRLDDWARNKLHADKNEEFLAWREITNFTTRFAISAVLVNLVVSVLPVFLVALSRAEAISSAFQPTSIGSPAPVYILLGGLAALLGAVIFSVLMIERFTLPSRLVLLPNDFETQLQARAGALLGAKFQVLTFGLIIIAVAIIAPVGYQQTIRVIYSEISSFQIFSDLRTQSVLLSSLALVLGIGFSYYATRSISDPVRDLIATFQKIEQGDLSQRVPVTGTDELATVASHFNRMISRLDILQTTLEQQVNERTKQLSATNEVGRVASSILDPDKLLSRVIDLFTDQFNYYYAAFFLIDPSGKWAELKEATGEAGRVLLQNRHRLEISGKSMVAACIRERSPRIAQFAAEEKQRFENPLLPYTRSEIALPLIVGDRVIGALNVQSTKESDFGPELIETMQNMASQVAIALENAHLFQEAQQSIKELRAIQQQYLLEGWSGFTARKEALEYEVGESVEMDAQTMQAALNLRDQILGQITLESTEEWTPEQQNLVDAVATQAAIALENARLVSESRQTAMRERALGEINSRIWASATIDGVLQTVVKELGRRLDTSVASIELHLDDEQ